MELTCSGCGEGECVEVVGRRGADHGEFLEDAYETASKALGIAALEVGRVYRVVESGQGS